MAISRWVGLGFEEIFGTPVPSKYYFDPNRVSLDSPNNPFQIYPGASGRGQRVIVPSSYIPEGDIETAVDTKRAGALIRAAIPEANYQQLSANKSSTTTALDGTHEVGATTLTVDDSIGFSEGDVIQVGADFGGSELHKVTGVATGEITILDGLTRAHSDDTDIAKLDPGAIFLHIMDFGGDLTDLDSMTIRVAKDIDSQVYQGCVIGQITLSVDFNTLLGLTASIVAQKDSTEPIAVLPSSAFTSQLYAGQHLTSARLVDTASPGTEDIGDYIRAASFTINNNVQGEDGLRMGSRFPMELKAGALDLTASLTLGFRTRDQYKDFWGASSPGNSDPKPRNIELKFAQGANLFEVYTYNSFLVGPVTEVSGRDMMTQTLEYQTIQRDPVGARGVMGAIRIQNSEEFRYS